MSPKELFQWNSRHMVVNFRDPKSVAAVKAIAQKSQFGASFGTRRKNLAGCFEYTKGFPHSTRKFAELLLEANPDSSAFFEVDQNPCMHGIGTPSENPAEWRCLSDFFSKGAALACPQKQIVTQ